MADEREKAANGGDERSCDEGGADNGGQGDTLQHLPQPETLADFLKQFPRHQIAPDKILYKEGNPVLHTFYVIFGKVEIKVAGEVIGVVKGPAVLGAEECHFRVSFPTYVHTAVAATPTSVVHLDKRGLAMVFKLDPDCAATYMRLQVELRKGVIERLGGIKQRVAKLGAALEETQDALLEKSPKKPGKLPPPPGELLKKWEAQCETIGVLLQILGTRAANLTGLLGELQKVVAAHPDWQKQGDFAAFVRYVEDLVTRDSKTDIVPP